MQKECSHKQLKFDRFGCSVFPAQGASRILWRCVECGEILSQVLHTKNDIWEFIKTLDIVSETDGDGVWIAYERGKREAWAGATTRENAIGKLVFRLYLETKKETA